jgi:hypothetical protein
VTLRDSGRPYESSASVRPFTCLGKITPKTQDLTIVQLFEDIIVDFECIFIIQKQFSLRFQNCDVVQIKVQVGTPSECQASGKCYNS